MLNKASKLALTALLWLVSGAGFAEEPQLLRHVEALSRDHYYVLIPDTESPYRYEGFIGGEHEHHFHILGFEGEEYVIVLMSPDGKAQYRTEGEGIKTLEREHGTLATIEARQGWVEVSVWAHPDSEYRLVIKKHRFEEN